MKKTNLILIISILTISLFGCKKEKKEVKNENKVTAELIIETADYEIAKVEKH